MHRVARAGGNPRRLPSIVPKVPKLMPPWGCFNARGRGAAVVGTLPRYSGWSFDRHAGIRVRPRHVFVKVRFVRATGGHGTDQHLRYLVREGVSRNGEPGQLFSTFTDEADRRAFVVRGREDRHQFRLIVSPEDGAAYDDLKPFTRDVMARVEADLGTILDWVAADHYDTGHPHIHVIIRGATEDGRILYIARDYLSRGPAHRASEVLTRDLGLQTEDEVQRRLQNEVKAERLTRLDRALMAHANDGVVDLRISGTSSDSERILNHALIGRVRQLERMQLAVQEEPLRWSISSGTAHVLKTMGERRDIVEAMHQAVAEAKLDRSPQLYTVHAPLRALVVGRIIGCGPADSLRNRRFIIVDGIDGRTHYADIGKETRRFPIGSVVRLSNRPTEPRQMDKTIAEIASTHGGRYDLDIHLRHDPCASVAFAEGHIRRLEAIGRTTGGADRGSDGSWDIASDYLDRAKAYEQGLARTKPVVIETLTTLPLAELVDAVGVTWLDRQLIGRPGQAHIRYGFGREVHEALLQRQQWLIAQGLMRRDGDEVVFRKNIFEVLTRREVLREAARLGAQIGKPFAETVRGQRVEGVVRRTLKLASGRFALIETSREFTLVPWRPELERHIGQAVSGIQRGNTFDWTIARGRDLSL
jgi:type IV secretory pathway VirD2 relaxase